jgi:hypothetical protein
MRNNFKNRDTMNIISKGDDNLVYLIAVFAVTNILMRNVDAIRKSFMIG